jgi:hypothetical protein
MIAGRNLLVEKSVTFSDFVVNGADFDATRQAARAGDRIMYRETDQGLRYYVKQGTAAWSATARRKRPRPWHGGHDRSVVRLSLPIFGSTT